ncbi:serine hydrolase domain-containing protein [Terriglobus tenax]|uniref:serine hydrolase domain-containing protein n=1 Tax=Terriglobus tenax TaxID=1111115 RepID=UPI0021E06BDB|nr:serine hydrolase domain-containing protein [Terriglobus tenax]
MTFTGSLDRRRFLQTAAFASCSLISSHELFAAPDNAACAQVVDSYVRDHQFQGVVALGRHGKPFFWKTNGFANVETRQPIGQNSVFGVASISKMLTAVTVLRLQEQSLLQLDQPIAAYLPYFRKDLGGKLTLRRLLANNSGVPNLFSSSVKADPALVEQPFTTQQAVHRFCEGDLIFTPGERFDYSASNWILVTAIIEAVTGQPYATAMQRLTVNPLGLKATTADVNATGVAAYDNATPPTPRTHKRQPYLAAGGGYYSNATDLMRAAHLIFDTGFLSAASKKELTTIEVPSDHYALGGRIRELTIGAQTVHAAWDTGNTSGYRSVLGHRLDGKATVVVLNNTSMSQKTLDEFSDALLAAFA